MNYSNLNALFLNCTLKKSPEKSNTCGLIDIAKFIMEKNGVSVEVIRPVDFDIPSGVYPDMTKHGYETDEWGDIFERVKKTDILVLTTPIWLGQKSSVAAKVIERLYAMTDKQNEKGQQVYYGKTGGCLVTGNEDGAKHCSMSILYSLQHLGFSLPPQADAYWVGDAGPGPSYLDEDSGGPENDFTNRNTSFLAWNLMHLGKILKDLGGFPAYGNQISKWNEGMKPDFPSASVH